MELLKFMELLREWIGITGVLGIYWNLKLIGISVTTSGIRWN